MIRNIIIKAALDCNISCKYCYVKHNRQYDTTNHVMKVDTLQVIMEKIGEYLKQSPKVDRLTLYWHGGEPLLCGKEFFQQSYLFQKKYFPSGVSVANTIQTNGTLLDLDWLNLIKKINYDICLSLDGPAEINDMWRQTRDGKGTYGQVVRAIELLKSQGFPVSLLSVVTPEALPHGRMIYRHLRELGATWIDFMYPFYSKIDNTIAQTVEPERWGNFFSDVFDAWIEEANPNVYIRLLNDLCMQILGGKTAMCSFNSDCSYVITIDPSGNVYTCDDILSYTDSFLGNISDNSLPDIASNPKLTALSKKSTLYGEQCMNCNYFNVCKGGCTLFRARQFGDFHSNHFFCDAQKLIIDHIEQYFKNIQATGDRQR